MFFSKKKKEGRSKVFFFSFSHGWLAFFFFFNGRLFFFQRCVGNADLETILEKHAVDIGKILAEFREASARRHDTFSQEYHFDNDVEVKALLRSKSQASGMKSHWRSRAPREQVPRDPLRRLRSAHR